MPKSRQPARQATRRLIIFVIITLALLTITVEGASGSRFAFLDSVNEFLGVQPTTTQVAALTIVKDFSNPPNDATGDTPEETVTAGGSSFFVIIVTNTGTSTANNVHITDTVDSRLIVDSVSGCSDQDPSAQGIDCVISSLAPGAVIPLAVSYHVSFATDTALVNNTAAADSDETTPVQDSDDVQIVENVILGIVKDFSNPPNDATGDFPEETVTAGGTSFFVIRVTNNGVSTADNVHITDTVDSRLIVDSVPGCSDQDPSTQGIDCLISSLAPGAVISLAVSYHVDTATDTALVNNTASVRSDEVTTPVPDSDDVQIIENATLTITKDFTNPPNDGAGDTPEETVTAGGANGTFFITVTNTGVSTPDNVHITDQVDSRLIVTSVTASPSLGADMDPGVQGIDWLIASLAAGQSVTLTVTYHVATTTDTALVSNTASVRSDEVTTPVPDSDDVQIIENATLTITKDFTNPPNDGAGDTPEETVTAGGANGTFFITVTNTGVSTPDNVHITDQVDSRLIVTSVTASPSLGADMDPGVQGIDWLIASLAAGQSVTLTVTYHVASATGTALVSNTASVRSDEVTTPVPDSDDVQIVVPDVTAPVITYTPIANTFSTTNPTLTATITDTVGVTGATIFWRVDGGGFTSNACTGPTGTPQSGTWLCTITGVTSPSAIGYYVTAHDAVPNTGTSPDVGASAPNLFTIGVGTVPAGNYSNISLGNGASLGGNVTVSGNLTLGGIVTAGANTLTLGCAATVTGSGAFSYVVGNVGKAFCGAAPFSYPVGTVPDGINGPETPSGAVGEYSPVLVTITAGVAGSILSVEALDAPLAGFNPATSLSRNWRLTETGDLTANLTFTYLDPGDVNGNEADYRVYSRNNLGVVTNWCPVTPCVNAGANTAGTINGVSTFSRWTAGQLQTPTAAGVSVSGRVLTPDGRGLRNTRVVLTDSQGVARTVTTSSFGFYQFDDVAAGQSYAIGVVSKLYHFRSQLIQVGDTLANVDFIALE